MQHNIRYSSSKEDPYKHHSNIETGGPVSRSAVSINSSVELPSVIHKIMQDEIVSKSEGPLKESPSKAQLVLNQTAYPFKANPMISTKQGFHFQRSDRIEGKENLININIV